MHPWWVKDACKLQKMYLICMICQRRAGLMLLYSVIYKFLYFYLCIQMLYAVAYQQYMDCKWFCYRYNGDNQWAFCILWTHEADFDLTDNILVTSDFKEVTEKIFFFIIQFLDGLLWGFLKISPQKYMTLIMLFILLKFRDYSSWFCFQDK